MFFYHLTNFPTGWFGYDQMALNADAMFDLGRHMWDKGLLPTTCTLLWSWLRTTLFMYTRWRYLVKSEKHFCAIVLNLAKIGLFCLPLTHYGKRFAKKFLQSFSHYFLWYDNLQASIWEPLNDAYLSTLLCKSRLKSHQRESRPWKKWGLNNCSRMITFLIKKLYINTNKTKLITVLKINSPWNKEKF